MRNRQREKVSQKKRKRNREIQTEKKRDRMITDCEIEKMRELVMARRENKR